MQKARCHGQKGRSNRLRACGFRVCFTPLFEVLFTFPSRYSCAIGLSQYLAFRDGAGRSRPSGYRQQPRQRRSYNPGQGPKTPPVWAPPRSLAATGGIILIFFSSG